jgi:hypothetical protein
MSCIKRLNERMEEYKWLAVITENAPMALIALFESKG